jgi:hypothetical protein
MAVTGDDIRFMVTAGLAILILGLAARLTGRRRTTS